MEERCGCVTFPFKHFFCEWSARRKPTEVKSKILNAPAEASDNIGNPITPDDKAKVDGGKTDKPKALPGKARDDGKTDKALSGKAQDDGKMDKDKAQQAFDGKAQDDDKTGKPQALDQNGKAEAPKDDDRTPPRSESKGPSPWTPAKQPVRDPLAPGNHTGKMYVTCHMCKVCKEVKRPEHKCKAPPTFHGAICGWYR